MALVPRVGIERPRDASVTSSRPPAVRRHPIRAIPVALAILLAVGACGTQAPTPSPSAAPTALPSPTAPAVTPDPSIVAGMPAWDELDERWGTYVSEREWGNPREAQGGDGWGMTYLEAIRQDYRFAEDGIAAISDENGELHVGWALWDGKAVVVTERLFGLTNPQGRHGETILDRRTFGLNTPTHSYADYRLEFPRPPGAPLENPAATPPPPATFDIRFETAKVDDGELVMRATVTNDSAAEATVHLVLKGWFGAVRPGVTTATPAGLVLDGEGADLTVVGEEASTVQASDAKRDLDRNLRDGGLVGPGTGRIGALHYELTLGAGVSRTLAFGLVAGMGEMATNRAEALRRAADDVIAARATEAAEVYADDVTKHRDLYAAALGSLMWSKSFYAWDGSGWQEDWAGRVDVRDVLLMPDKWEYPWLASWDTAFHAVTAALVDPDLGAAQLRFLVSDRWQQPDGHVPCAEWVMDVECPPLFGWAALRIAEAYAAAGREADGEALLRDVYPGLARQYGYWQAEIAVGDGLYAGGFLGMDNLPRGEATPSGPSAQADGSAWMAAFARDLARIAERIGDPDAASRYLADRETVAAAVNARLWDEATGFYYDADGDRLLLIQSYTGLVPLIAGIEPPERIQRVLDVIRDPAKLGSPHGLRSMAADAFRYIPGWAGRNVNSNWRGPIWMPINYLVIDALRDPDPSLSAEIRDRTIETVARGWRASGRFFEYFDGNTGAGLGADAQTGWTAVVANLIAEGWPAAP